VRGRRLAVEHVLSMLAAGDSTQDILHAYPFLEADDIRACILYIHFPRSFPRRFIVPSAASPTSSASRPDASFVEVLNLAHAHSFVSSLRVHTDARAPII